MTERWLPVFGYEGLYEVSDLGRVRSLVRNLPGYGGTVRPYGGKILSVSYANRGYAQVSLCADGIAATCFVHVLVCRAFHGPKPQDKELVAHGDGDPSNARANNLRWATYAENEEDKARHGTKLVGEDTNNVKLTEAQVLRIRAMGGSCEAVGALFGVDKCTISDIRRGKTWKHLPGAPRYDRRPFRRQLVTVDGITLSILEWAKASGLRQSTIHRRLRLGWDPEIAVTAPLTNPSAHWRGSPARLARL